MAQRHYLKLEDASTVEITDRIATEGWELTEKAEEGAVGSSPQWIADPGMDLAVAGLRAYWVLEDESEATDNVLFGGFVGDPELGRGEQGGIFFDPVARNWQVTMVDRNSFWPRRLMTGTDCKRPAETDEARIAWLFASSEANWIEDDTTYVVSGSGSSMDKNDYRNQYLNQVVDDCAQHTGRNWWVQLQETGSGRQDVAWYGKDSRTVYSSDLYLSNDPADWVDDDLADGTSLVWPIAGDTRLRDDWSRVYTGATLRYDNGRKAIYRKNADVDDPGSPLYNLRRDTLFDYPNVRTKAKAVARLTRLLADCATPDQRITTSVVLPKGKATKIRAGMRVRIKATHLTAFNDQFYWMRVLSCTVSPRDAGERYTLKLELQASGSVAAGGAPYTGSAFAALLNQNDDNGSEYFVTTGDSPEGGWYAEPTVGAMWTFNAGGGGYVSITTSVGMRVRIECVANFGTVATAATATLAVKVNGTTIASDVESYTGSLAAWSGTCSVDLEYDLNAGDTVSFSATTSGFLAGGFGAGDVSTNTTVLRIGRGYQDWEGSNFWVGA